MKSTHFALGLALALGFSACSGYDDEGADSSEQGSELGTVEQAITVDHSGTYGWILVPPGGFAGNEPCKGNDPNEICFFPSSKTIGLNIVSSTFTANALAAVGTDLGLVRTDLSAANKFAGTGFSTVMASAAAASLLIVEGDHQAVAGVDQFVSLGCNTPTALVENVPGLRSKCTQGFLAIDTSGIMAAYPAAPDFNREIRHALGHGILTWAGLGPRGTNPGVAGTYQSSSQLILGNGPFTTLQKCLLTKYNPAGNTFIATPDTCTL